jgi:hypothetical protein
MILITILYISFVVVTNIDIVKTSKGSYLSACYIEQEIK